MTELSSLYKYHYISDSHKMRKGLDIVKPVPHNSQSRSLAVSQSRSLAVSQSRINLSFLHTYSIVFSQSAYAQRTQAVFYAFFIKSFFAPYAESLYHKNGGALCVKFVAF